MTYSGDLNSKVVQYSNGPKQFAPWMVRYSGQCVWLIGSMTDGWNNKFLVRYLGHVLNYELLPDIWIANKWKFIFQMFVIQISIVLQKVNVCLKWVWVRVLKRECQNIPLEGQIQERQKNKGTEKITLNIKSVLEELYS